LSPVLYNLGIEQPTMGTLSDLVGDWKLKCIVDGNCTIQTRHVSNPATGQWRSLVQERWKRKKRLGSGSFGTVWLEECVSGPSQGQVRAVKELHKGTAPSSSMSPSNFSRELEAIFKFSHELVWN
jgi:calcium/calmodulin-dependent protein kinase I